VIRQPNYETDHLAYRRAVNLCDGGATVQAPIPAVLRGSPAVKTTLFTGNRPFARDVL